MELALRILFDPQLCYFELFSYIFIGHKMLNHEIGWIAFLVWIGLVRLATRTYQYIFEQKDYKEHLKLHKELEKQGIKVIVVDKNKAQK